MRYISFRIRNFKGIKDTKINFNTIGGASVFAFVGLNESGKTTILEAIHSFRPDKATSELIGGDVDMGVPYEKRVPRHLISDFTGDVSVQATISITADDKINLANIIRSKHKIHLDITSFPSELILERHQRFENGNFQQNFFTLRSNIRVKTSKQRNWRRMTQPESILIRDEIYGISPLIAYFPTFVFDFPREIFLTDRGNKIDRFYRRVFQDILDFDGRGHTIEKDIINRIRQEKMTLPFIDFFSIWKSPESEESKIQHIIDRASSTVTNTVFGRWNEIFGEDTKGKEIVISQNVIEGEIVDENGNKSKTNEHDLSVKFQIKDGTRRFDVNDRSLGFRWFFSFMLFTQFRVARANQTPVLFLFDEPASNLHSKAQQKLLECFPEIAQQQNSLIYTTHSHYMINPLWLEQTFIVSNRADSPPESLLDEVSLDDESLDVKASSYRSFVNANPSQTSYFQPILERLEVVPSKFDIQKSSIILEGKSDYYILSYAARLINNGEYCLLPAFGASSLDTLIALHLGWGLDLVFLLDGDEKGKKEKERYMKSYSIGEESIVTIDQLQPGISVIEDLLEKEDLEFIKNELKLAKPPKKGDLTRFFQERVACNNITALSDSFVNRAGNILVGLNSRFKAIKSTQ